MKKIYIALLITLIGTAVMAQQPDAVYKLIRQEWTVNEDGTSDYHYRHEVQILRNRALTAYADKGETFVLYNPDMEEVVVNEVYTIQEDGTKVGMPQNAFVYQLPSECVSCGRFAHMRELAMVHTGMELGCTVVVDYTIHRHYNLLNETIELVKDCPVERWEVNVSVPQGHDLRSMLSAAEGESIAFSEKKENDSYSLVALNIPQQYADSYLPARELLYASLHLFNGEAEYRPDFDREGLQAADDVVNQLLASHDSKENIEAIRNYVVDNIHLNDIAPARLGYRHSTAAEVWQSGCGTTIDKAVLLTAMLNQAGYKADVAGDSFDEVSVKIDAVEYRMSVRDKKSLAVYGKAEDAIDTVWDRRSFANSQLDTLEAGFYRLPLQPIKASVLPASSLAISRTAPLQSKQCNIDVEDTYTLPKGAKLEFGTIEHKLDYPGVGQVEVRVKLKGKKLVVRRKLVLEQSIVPVVDYAHFRELVALWQDTQSVILKIK